MAGNSQNNCADSGVRSRLYGLTKEDLRGDFRNLLRRIRSWWTAADAQLGNTLLACRPVFAVLERTTAQGQDDIRV